MAERILCVDDDPNILAAYKRQFRKQFSVEVAEGGQRGLEIVRLSEPFAVVVADMQMPGMNGIQFLSEVKKISPNTVRMMLTGNADQQTAVDAVNEGHIFRFLNKPCPPETLAKALVAGIEQYRLITAEKELLEKTLLGSIKVLTEVLSLVNPTAFGRASRVQRLATQLAAKLQVPHAWQLKIAAMLSQLGCVTVPETTLAKVFAGTLLNHQEQQMFMKHPQIGAELIVKIPRLQPVSQIIAYQEKGYDGSGWPADKVKGQDIPLGSRILKVALDFDTLQSEGINQIIALSKVKEKATRYDRAVLEALELVIAEESKMLLRAIDVRELRESMVLAEDIRTTHGLLLVAKGQEVGSYLRERLINYAVSDHIARQVHVFVLPDESKNL